MESRLHNLCDVCRSIKFNLHELAQCESLGCTYAPGDSVSNESYTPPNRPFNREALETHSLQHCHHNSVSALKRSALHGCHLCTLLAFALDNSNGPFSEYTVQRFPYSQSNGVILVYHKSTKWVKKEELEVFCGAQFSALPITDLLPSSCSDQPFLGNIWPSQGIFRQYFADADTLFYARCINGKHPWLLPRTETTGERIGLELVDGFVRLINYLPGQV